MPLESKNCWQYPYRKLILLPNGKNKRYKNLAESDKRRLKQIKRATQFLPVLRVL
jgi:hypothetical protein